MAEKLARINAIKLRIILSTTIILVIVITAVAFWLFRSQLTTYAEQVQQDKSAASVSGNDINQLKALKKQMEDNQVAVTRAKNIVADSQHYQYQNQIIDDITTYAKNSGLTLTGFEFTSDTTAGSSGAAGAGTTTTQTATPVGLKTVTATVTIKNPVSYESFIRFIHAIEVNLTKMQIANISMTRQQDSKTLITADPIIIEVYTR